MNPTSKNGTGEVGRDLKLAGLDVGALLLLLLIIGFTAGGSSSTEPALIADAGNEATEVLSTSTSPERSAASTTYPALAAAAAAMPASDSYEVVEVVDGDTIKVRQGGELSTVRMIGLDTPETVHPAKPVECFGREASTRAKALLTGKEVRLETDPSQDTRDHYGRLLAYVFLEDGTLVNEAMIAGGYGHEYTYSQPYRYQAAFKAAERAARDAGKGLWAPGVCEETSAPVGVPAQQAQSEPEPAIATPARSEYTCSADIYNCDDFSSHAEAQAAYEACGGVGNDVHGLDRDKDGSACDSLR